MSGYAVAFGGFLLFGRRATDRIGPRWVLLAGLFAYGAGSLLGGLAVNPALLIAGRVVQGLGGALLFPATLASISVAFPAGPQRNRAYAVWGTKSGAGMLLGSLTGGVLTQALGWSAVFYVNIPLVVLASAMVLALLDRGLADRSGSFALPTAVTATLRISAVIFAVVQGPDSGWDSAIVISAFGACLIALAAAALLYRRCGDPLIPVSLVRTGGFALGSAITFLYMATFGTLLYFLTIYFQNLLLYSAFQTGIAILVPMAAIAIGAQLAGRLGARVETKHSWSPACSSAAPASSPCQ